MTPRTPISRGAGLFGEPPPEAKPLAWRANVDGGSRGNPGPASYGVVIRDPRGEVVARLKKYIGRTTNNVAEYYGLIAALDYAQSNSIKALRVESDSELLVKQMQGQYKVKSADLKPLYERAKKMSQALPAFRIDHVYREQNREADLLANEAMDEASGKPPAAASRNPKVESGNSKSENRNSIPTIKVRARFRSGILYPLEDVDLPDGAEVEILLRPTSKS
ncbi:MAG TPA: reverse transcriptase-like protein [Candidatus Acidoferrum sp.]|jgi:ribonuclease HI|nr:reverse transcriptase-like protein [Candidatus Acidoferrum sp.]